jgi:UDP-N-acetylmuramoyl-L-alanyl-D-glutamate--2,6-diaminopimelate ligase
MVGRYNVYNYLTSLLLVLPLGYTVDEVLALNETLSAPVGRMEMITYGTNSIFVDYAHTPDAVINVLTSSLEYKKGRVITIVGCGGDRDRTKRPIMGHAAEEYSDYVIYTSDNPRTEDPKLIIDDILEGVKKDNHEVIVDRKEAILKGMSMLDQSDILMILGKGHEDYQIIGTEKHHFSDQEIVREYIKEHE